MLKDKYIYELKHDVAGLLNLNAEYSFGTNISIRNTFFKIPESIANYIAVALFKKNKIKKEDVDKTKQLFRKHVLIKETINDNIFTLILHFPKHRSLRKQHIISAVAILNEKDTFDSEIAFKIAVNRVIDTTNIGEIVSLLLLNRKSKQDSLKEIKERIIYVPYPWLEYPWTGYPEITWTIDTTGTYTIKK